MFLKNKNISLKIKRSKVTDYAALSQKFYFKEILPVSFIKKYAKQNLNVESISYKRVVQEGLRL